VLALRNLDEAVDMVDESWNPLQKWFLESSEAIIGLGNYSGSIKV
jgi:hypothetical protein